jgi:hypothetical protein
MKNRIELKSTPYSMGRPTRESRKGVYLARLSLLPLTNSTHMADPIDNLFQGAKESSVYKKEGTQSMTEKTCLILS